MSEIVKMSRKSHIKIIRFSSSHFSTSGSGKKRLDVSSAKIRYSGSAFIVAVYKGAIRNVIADGGLPDNFDSLGRWTRLTASQASSARTMTSRSL